MHLIQLGLAQQKHELSTCPATLYSSADDEDDVGNGDLESDDEKERLKRTEDEHPELQEVVRCRKTGKRQNSSKGFIYTLHKET